MERLRAELERMRDEARESIEQTHRQYRRDLVPLRQAAVVLPAATGPGRTGGSPWPSTRTAGR